MTRLLLTAALYLLGACHVARVKPAQPTCHDNAVVSCESCTNRGCAWCSEGPDPSDGYCCETGGRCASPIRDAQACKPIPDCERATVNGCDACLARGCAWCPGETRCHARGRDGTFPSCDGRIAGALSCPGAEP